MNVLRSYAQRLGLPPLDFSLDEHSRGKIMRASILPFAVFSAALIRLAMDIVLDLQFASAYGILLATGLTPGGDEAPDVWWHVYRVAFQLGHLEYLATASLFAAGIFRWSRSEGSWMFLTGGTLAAASLIAGLVLALLFLVSTDAEFLYIDLRVASFESLTETLSLLSIGYFFLAYRGLASQGQAKRRRRVIRRPPSSGLASLDD